MLLFCSSSRCARADCSSALLPRAAEFCFSFLAPSLTSSRYCPAAKAACTFSAEALSLFTCCTRGSFFYFFPEASRYCPKGSTHTLHKNAEPPPRCKAAILISFFFSHASCQLLFLLFSFSFHSTRCSSFLFSSAARCSPFSIIPSPNAALAN